jgi:hypothetical protein
MRTCKYNHIILGDALPPSSNISSTNLSPLCPKCTTPLVDIQPYPDTWSYSRLSSYQRCPRYAYYSYEMQLSRKDYGSDALDFGSLWHEIMEIWYTWKGSWEKGRQAVFTHIANQVQVQMEAESTQNIPRYFLPITENEDPKRSYAHMVRLFDEYTQFYGQDSLKVIRTADIPYTEKYYAIDIGEGVLVTGLIDLIVEQQGHNYVLDHKTTAWASRASQATYRLSHQITGYLYAVHTITDIPVRGAIINMIALNKIIKPERDFIRIYTQRTIEQMEAWREQTLRQVAAYRKNQQDGHWDQYTHSCNMYNRECDYFSLCTAGADSHDIRIEGEYVHRKYVDHLNKNIPTEKGE